jgi:hypothetical protein
MRVPLAAAVQGRRGCSARPVVRALAPTFRRLAVRHPKWQRLREPKLAMVARVETVARAALAQAVTRTLRTAAAQPNL